MTPPILVVNDVDASRFEIVVNGGVATLAYSKRDGKLYLIHTEVPKALEGRGYGSALARAALDHAKASGLGVVAWCPFIQAYLKRHPEYEPLVER